MENKIDKKSTTILIIILICTLIVAILGVTYAYFQIIVKTTGGSSMLIKATNLEITYAESKNISGDGIMPGWSDTKTFTVTNTGEETITYSLLWSEVSNTLVNKSYLQYTLSGTGTNAFNSTSPTVFPSESNVYIFRDLSIASGVIHAYTMTVSYLNDTSFDQSDDMTKTFAASLEVEASES